MLKLYGGVRSRAAIVRWYLEELNLAYEYIQLDMQAGEHRLAPFLAINPFGKVPAIVDEEFQLWESGAILMYLADKYGDEMTTPERRAKVAQWVLFANATLGPGIFVESSREKETPRLLTPLNERLTTHPYMMGSTFGVADVAVGAYLFYIPMMLKVTYEGYPALTEYLARLSERPAFQKTMKG